MSTASIPIADIVVNGRHRKNLGDLADLKASIADVGLLQPVVVNSARRLIAGERRLRAAEQLGWTEIPALIANDLDDVTKALHAERDENTCRMDMKPSEKIALGQELERLERPKAEARIKAGKAPCEKFTQGRAPAVREMVGAAVGMSGPTYQRAKMVVVAAENGTTTDGVPVEPDVQEVAREAAAEMDATGNVTGAYNKVQAKLGRPLNQRPKREPDPSADKQPFEERVKQITALARDGNRSQQIAEQLGISEDRVRTLANKAGVKLPDANIGRARRIDPVRVVTESVNALEGVAMGLGLIEGVSLSGVDKAQLQIWSDSLANSFRAINRLRKQLTEAIQ